MPEDTQHLLSLLNRYDAICTTDPHNDVIAASWDETWRKLRAMGAKPIWNEERKYYEFPMEEYEEGKSDARRR